MKVEMASDAEIAAVFKRTYYAELYKGMSTLAVGDACKGKCEWSHYTNKAGSESCNGRTVAKDYAKRLGFSVRQTCANGTFYVQRIK